MQIIYTANEEVARGLYNPAYKLLQMLPGRQTKGQLCIQKFHSVMQDLMQEVACKTPMSPLCKQLKMLRSVAQSGLAPLCISPGSAVVNLHATSMCNTLTSCYPSFSIADMAADEEQRSAKR